MKRIVVLGSTGSIGRSTLDVVARHHDEFEVVGLAARRNGRALARQCAEHPRARFCVSEESGHREALAESPGVASRSVGWGDGALGALIAETKPDLVVNAVLGFAGLRPTMAALDAGIPVAIANKEAVVTGGAILVETARRSGAALVPIDSEHVAIRQCLGEEPVANVARVVITASGGALRDHPLEALGDARVEDVLAHPTWKMGAKITVDSATLVNKGLEIIEAHWLFGMPYEKIDVIIHPQSIVHSMVEFVDGSVMAQMGQPDMRIPILYALAWPRRIESSVRGDVMGLPDLTFRAVDPGRYPCLGLAVGAARAGGTAPTVLNAANEVAVGAFLGGRLPFRRIHEIIAAALDALASRPVRALEDIVAADAETRRWVRETFSLPDTDPYTDES